MGYGPIKWMGTFMQPAPGWGSFKRTAKRRRRGTLRYLRRVGNEIVILGLNPTPPCSSPHKILFTVATVQQGYRLQRACTDCLQYACRSKRACCYRKIYDPFLYRSVRILLSIYLSTDRWGRWRTHPYCDWIGLHCMRSCSMSNEI